MSDRCTDIRADLLAHAAGELSGLPVERVELHLRHCAACRRVAADFEHALTDARSLGPEPLSDADVGTLARHLHAAAPSRRRPMLLVAGGGLAFATAAALVVLMMRSSGEMSPATLAERSSADGVERLAVDAASPMVDRASPFVNVRIISGEGFNAAFEKNGTDLNVEQKSGFAVFAFRGDGTSKLQVRTPSANVRVVGTIFYVDVVAGSTHVGVGRGKVIVSTAAGEHEVSTGQRVAFDADGRAAPLITSAGASFLDDEELVSFHDSESASASKPAYPGEVSQPKDTDGERRGGDRPKQDIGDVVFEAERLTRADRARDARKVLSSALADPAHVSSKDLLRFEIARLDGLSLGAAEKARPALERLAKHGGAGMRIQATLLLCEIELASDRCGARACLERVRAQGGSVAEEATRLSQRWAVRELQCKAP